MAKSNTRTERATEAFNLTLIAGILIIINGILLGVVAKWFIGIMPVLPGSTGNDPTLLIELAAAGLIFGILVLLGTLMLRLKPENQKIWGIMLIAFSIPSVIMGGGFIIGFILGIIGGKIAFSGKRKEASKPAPTVP